jgi:MFS family permease
MTLWGNADFLRFWSAQTISQLGSQITMLALPLVALLLLDASPFEVAVLATVEWLPWLLFSLPVGAWIDRVHRRPVMILADLARGFALLSIPIAYWLDALTLGQLYVVGFATGVLTVFFDVAYQSYLPSLVERSQLSDGNSKLEISRSAAGLIGPGVAGALIGLVTAPVAILADAISFLASAGLLVRIRRGERVEPPPRESRLLAEIVEGIRWVFGHEYLRPGMATVAISNFFGNILWTMVVVYAVRRLDWTPATIGLVFALGNLGFLAGAALAPRISRRVGIGPGMIASGALCGWPLLLMPLAPADYAIPLFVAAGIVTSFGIVVFNVIAISLFQAITPDRLLGRMNASRRFVVWGVIPLGQLASGGLAVWIGLRPTLFVGAAGVSLAFLPLVFSPVRQLRVLPDEEPAVAAA